MGASCCPGAVSDNSGGSGSGGGSFSFYTSSTNKNEAELTGAGSAGNSSILISVSIGAGGASADTKISIYNVFGSTVRADGVSKRSYCNVHEGEAIDGDRRADAQDKVSRDGSGEADGLSADDGDQVQTIESIVRLVNGAADVVAYGPRELVLGDLTTVGDEAGSRRSKSDPTESYSVDNCQSSHRHPDCQVSSLQVGWGC